MVWPWNGRNCLTGGLLARFCVDRMALCVRDNHETERARALPTQSIDDDAEGIKLCCFSSASALKDVGNT